MQSDSQQINIFPHTTAILRTFALVALISTSALLAQEDEADTSDAIALSEEEIVVTAKRREQNIEEVPMSLSVFSEDAFVVRGVTTLVDIGKFVPNLNVTTFSAGNPNGGNAFVRGIGIQDHLILTDPGVAVYVDGVYLGRTIGQNWDLANIERLSTTL